MPGLLVVSCVKGPSYRVAKNLLQKIKNQNWALIGRSVSTSTMVILIYRKICFQPRSLGGLFFLFSGCLFYSKFMRCAPPSVPHIQSALVPPSLPRHTREHTASTHSSVLRKMSNPPADQQIAPRGTRTSTSANCEPAKRERACCRREVRQQLTTAATGAQLAGMTCSPQGKHEPMGPLGPCGTRSTHCAAGLVQTYSRACTRREYVM